MDIETLKQRIASSYDADVVVDLLGITVEQLLNAFEDLVLLHRDVFIDLDDVEVEDDDDQDAS